MVNRKNRPLSGADICSTFVNPNPYKVPGYTWPKQTHLLCTLTTEDGDLRRLFKSDLENHAERQMVQALPQDSPVFHPDKSPTEKSPKKEKEERLKIACHMVISYSPCPECSELLDKWFKEVKEVCDFQLKITMSSFMQCHVTEEIPKEKVDKSVGGLQKLLKAGVEMDVFHDLKQWNELVFEADKVFVKMPDTSKSTLAMLAQTEERKKREDADLDLLKEIRKK